MTTTTATLGGGETAEAGERLEHVAALEAGQDEREHDETADPEAACQDVRRHREYRESAERRRVAARGLGRCDGHEQGEREPWPPRRERDQHGDDRQFSYQHCVTPRGSGECLPQRDLRRLVCQRHDAGEQQRRQRDECEARDARAHRSGRPPARSAQMPIRSESDIRSKRCATLSVTLVPAVGESEALAGGAGVPAPNTMAPARRVEVVLRDCRKGDAVGPRREPRERDAKLVRGAARADSRPVTLCPRPSKSWTRVSAGETGSVNRKVTTRGARARLTPLPGVLDTRKACAPALAGRTASASSS